MNERDKELAKQAWTENDWDGHVDIPKLIQLVRTDEREACAKACENYGESCANEWNKNLGVADDLRETAEECAAAIRARGNT